MIAFQKAFSSRFCGEESREDSWTRLRWFEEQRWKRQVKKSPKVVYVHMAFVECYGILGRVEASVNMAN
jgi:hypothetical protein